MFKNKRSCTNIDSLKIACSLIVGPDTNDVCGYCWPVSFDFEMMYFDLARLVLVRTVELTAGPSNVNRRKKLSKKVEDRPREVS